jgi:hypothetical protein
MPGGYGKKREKPKKRVVKSWWNRIKPEQKTAGDNKQ